MVYGTFLGGGDDGGDSQGVGRRWWRVTASVAAAGGLVGACCLAATSIGISSSGGVPIVSLEQQQQQQQQESSATVRSQAMLQELAQTSARTNLAHPYGSMYPANPTFINPNKERGQAVNPAPKHPYHNGVRPKAVLNEDFDHAPFGHHLPWENGPEGALAKYDKDTRRMVAYRYMVDNNGVVKRWDTELDRGDVDPNHVGAGTLAKLSPLPAPGPSATDVAEALVNQQLRSIGKSFRDIVPNGAFHDSVVDGQNGQQVHVPDQTYGTHHVECPAGLVRCPDTSCVASMSYCPGCHEVPMPAYCSANPERPSGWRPSMIGCENQTQISNCGMLTGQGLFLPGEAVTDGIIGGGLQ